MNKLTCHETGLLAGSYSTVKKWDFPWLVNKVLSPLSTGILSTGLAAAYYSGGKVCSPLSFLALGNEQKAVLVCIALEWLLPCLVWEMIPAHVLYLKSLPVLQSSLGKLFRICLSPCYKEDVSHLHDKAI